MSQTPHSSHPLHPSADHLPPVGAQTRSFMAHAKLNLFLHVTNKLDNGFHSLDSMIGFSAYGDRLRLDPSDQFHLSYSGPFAETLSRQSGTDLVEKAAHAYAEARGCAPAISLHLEKNLPIASGIGGGSADAAAVLKGLSHYFGPLPEDKLNQIALSLGADVPMCLSGKAAIARGIGEELTPVPNFSEVPILLVNPMIQVPTPAIFKARQGDFTPNINLAKIPSAFQTVQSLLTFLDGTHNDLAPPAIQLAPEIDLVLSALSQQSDCLLARMSGSGATCFAFFPDLSSCQKAKQNLQEKHTNWWIQSSKLISAPYAPVTG